MRKFFTLFLCLLLTSSVSATGQPTGISGKTMAQTTDSSFVEFQSIEYFSFDELISLSKNPKPSDPKFRKKLRNFFKTPIISNESYYKGIRPETSLDLNFGPLIRVASWNIEKSLNIDRIKMFLASEPAAKAMIDSSKVTPGSAEFDTVGRQRSRLVSSDILILQEMEVGVKRSDDKDAARELAELLEMNYAYAPQYLEIDPVILGAEHIALEEGGDDTEAESYYRADPNKYKGVFGSAVLSKYPIKHVEMRPLVYQAYDWYEGEKQSISFLEKARRLGTKTAFKNEITREIKVGGRGYFRVDLEVPGLPENTLTIINIHLEIKCQPEDREKQMAEILSYIKAIKNPVIMMGDYNAAPTDISPTNVGRVVKRTVTNPTNIAKLAVHVLVPASTVVNATQTVSNVTKNFNDPFAADVKVVAPNKLKAMFEMIREFRFSDGTVFDFRGDPERSIGAKNELLANSNQRGFKGFKTTFSVKRALGFVGKLRLDWVFVKSGLLRDQEDKTAPYRLAPHFGETLEEMNASLIEPLSDHHPNVLDIPLFEPKITHSSE